MGLGHARTYLKGYLMAIEKTFIMIKPDAVRDRKIARSSVALSVAALSSSAWR